jgi:type VI secretion system ImpA/VasJ family protein
MSAILQESDTETPVPDSAVSSCGSALDWQNDPDLLWVKAEIEKTTAIPRRAADWQGLLERCERLLARSTDWLLLCAAARAAVHLRGVSALPESIALLSRSAQQSWAQMHPEIPRGLKRRASFLEWFVEGLAESLPSKALAEGTLSGLLAVKNELVSLDEILKPLFPQHGEGAYPGVGTLLKAIEAAHAEADSSRERSPETPAAKGSTSAAPVSEFPPSITDLDAAEGVLGKVRQALFAVAESLQLTGLADPEHFRYRRMAAWLRVCSVSPSEDGILSAAGPNSERFATLQSALSTDVRGVLEEAESALRPFPLWLDANYLSFVALSRLGPDYEAARGTVCSETVSLVVRFPKLMQLKFENGVRLAADDTREWLSAELSKLGPWGAREGLDASPSQPNDRFAAAEQAASELAAAGRLDESFGVFSDNIRGGVSGRERFRWRMVAARHAARHGREDVAFNVLEDLDHEAAELKLDLWEPDLWAEVLKEVLELGRRDGNGRIAAAIEARPNQEKRLARLDLLAAVKLAEGRRR